MAEKFGAKYDLYRDYVDGNTDKYVVVAVDKSDSKKHLTVRFVCDSISMVCRISSTDNQSDLNLTELAYFTEGLRLHIQNNYKYGVDDLDFKPFPTHTNLNIWGNDGVNPNDNNIYCFYDELRELVGENKLPTSEELRSNYSLVNFGLGGDTQDRVICQGDAIMCVYKKYPLIRKVILDSLKGLGLTIAKPLGNTDLVFVEVC